VPNDPEGTAEQQKAKQDTAPPPPTAFAPKEGDGGGIKGPPDHHDVPNTQQPPPNPPSRWSAFWGFFSKHEWVMVFLTAVIAATGVVGIILVIKGGSDTKKMISAAQQQACAAQQFAHTASLINGNINDAVTKLDAQAKATQDATNAARNAMQLEERAWVAETGVSIDYPQVGKMLIGTVTWTNSGKTFAKRVKCNIYFSFTPEQFATEKSLLLASVNSKNKPRSIAVLGPGLPYPSSYDLAVPTTDLAVRRITTDWNTYVWGDLSYLDVFGRRHRTSFCQWRKGATETFIQCAFHNDAD
jgi:hypothetical protein